MRNRQVGPDDAADVLAELVQQVTYKPGWRFELKEVERGQGSEGLTLLISATVPDSFNPDAQIGFCHLFPVLPANYDREAWMGWILECILMLEKHEALEWFRVDGNQPYFPSHAPGKNPYAVYRVRDKSEAYGEATPWFGGSVTDEHFDS